MTCFECGNGQLRPARVNITGTRNGETFTVALDGFKCEACGFQTVDSEQGAELTRLVSDAYRQAHSLLTGEEIKERRQQLGMSQQEFADYLGSGVASVKRWESGKIQERAMDQLLRLKTDPGAARRNLQDLEAQGLEVHVLSTGTICGRAVELLLPFREQSYMRAPRISLDDNALVDVALEENIWAAA